MTKVKNAAALATEIETLLEPYDFDVMALALALVAAQRMPPRMWGPFLTRFVNIARDEVLADAFADDMEREIRWISDMDDPGKPGLWWNLPG